MRTRWLTRYGLEGASSRYRAHQYLRGLEALGIHCTASALAPWQGTRREIAAGLIRRWRDLEPARTSSYDALVMQKEPVMPPRLWPAARSQLARRSVPLIWDIDDAVWIGRAGAEQMASEMAELSDVVVAGNSMLAMWARNAGARRVTVIPTCFEPSSAVPRRPAHSGSTIRLVWIGSPATSQLLDDRADELRQLVDGLDYELTIVGGVAGPRLGRLNVTTVPWTPAAEHEHLANADYGLAVQPRTPYADHKCGFKIVQYMAYGIVPIATDTPVHRDIVATTGHLLSDDASLGAARDAMSSPPTTAARTAVLRRWQDSYSRAAGLRAWHELLNEVGSST